jgi:hypothetical protein
LASLAFAACATPKVNDITLGNRPVVETSIETITNAPETWNGKWVQLEGWIISKSSILLSNPTWPTDHDGITVPSILLDPQLAQRQPTRFNHQHVVVTGRVDLECQRIVNEMMASVIASKTISLDPMIIGPKAYCNNAYGPNLEDVKIQTKSVRQ